MGREIWTDTHSDKLAIWKIRWCSVVLEYRPTHSLLLFPSPSHKTAALFVLSVIPKITHFSIIYENSSVNIGLGQEDMTTTQCTMLLFLRCGTERRTITGTQLGEHAMQAF
jgi:hypothetical protein